MNIFLLFPIAVCALLVILFTILNLIKILNSQDPEKIGLVGVWLPGVLALLFGRLGHLLAMKEAFHVISYAGDVNASMVAEPMGGTFFYWIAGLSVLIISLILWGILKGVVNARKSVDQ